MLRLSTLALGWLALAAAGPPGPPGGPGMPFGLFGMKGVRLVEPYTSAMQQAQPATVLADLAAASARGARIVVNLAGGGARFTSDAQGHFDYDLWKARMDRFLPLAGRLDAYARDGTLLAVMLIDEPFSTKRWGGERVPTATLDRMAKYSKSLFPHLPTTIGEAPSELGGYPWRYLDLAWAQYTVRKGPIAGFAARESQAARAEGFGLIVGLNISKGGDGSSGFGRRNEWSMSGREILQYGQPLLDVPNACAFISWDSRPSVIGRPDVAAALGELARAARAHPTAPCGQRGGTAAPGLS